MDVGQYESSLYGTITVKLKSLGAQGQLKQSLQEGYVSLIHLDGLDQECSVPRNVTSNTLLLSQTYTTLHTKTYRPVMVESLELQ